MNSKFTPFSVFVFLFSCWMGYFNPVESYGQKKLSLPRIGIGIGGFTGFTDIKSQDYKPGLQYKLAYHIYLEEPVAKPLSLGIHFITGKVYGSQTIQGYDLNFQSTIFSQSLRLNYNFFPLIKTKSKNMLYPFVGVGVGFVTWRSKGDYKDQSGKYYADYDSTQPYSKDHLFETDLRQANLDRFGKYPQISLELPIFLGLDIRIKKGLNARINAEYHLTFSDMIDNVSSKGIGARQGKKGYDNLLAISAGINYNLAYAEDEDAKPQDLDFDGIVDSKDKCDNTPAGVRVDKKGCPVDDNNNGTPDYLEEGSMANQDFKNNIDPNKPVVENSVNSENKSDKENLNPKQENPPAENTAQSNSTEGSTSKEQLASNQTKANTKSKIVGAQEESDAPVGAGSNAQTGSSEVGNNRGTLAATMEEDGKPNVVISNSSVKSQETEAKATENNTTSTNNPAPESGKDKSKSKKLNKNTDSNVVVNTAANGNQLNSKSGTTQSPSGVETASASSAEDEAENNPNALNEKAQSNTNSGGGDEVESLNEQSGKSEAGLSGSELAKSSSGSVKSEGNGATVSPAASGQNTQTPNSGSAQKSNSESISGGSEGTVADVKTTNNSTTSNSDVKVVSMDADEDFKPGSSTTTKSGINLKDAQTAKAEFAKANEGKANSDNELPSAVDLSSRLGRFAFADINKNGKISIAEVNHFIDQFFDNGEEMNIKVSDIRDLIDFYFEQ
ncbi:MAG: hypothetical protein K1X82_10235 [Bacteroidia bacterium]|nr:hypothetical protein [Bacteroidia bacterium]